MQQLKVNANLWKLLLPVLLIVFMRLSPRDQDVVGLFKKTASSLENGSDLEISQNYAALAARLPERSAYWEIAGIRAFDADHLEDAVNYFNHALKEEVISQGGLYKLGEAYINLGKSAHGLLVWESISSYIAADDMSIDRMVAEYLSREDYEAAIDFVEGVIGQSSSNQQIAQLSHQAGLIQAANEPRKALVHLVRANDLDPLRYSRERQLISEIERTLNYSDPAYSLVASGRALSLLNQWDLAIHAFEKAAQLRPDYAEAWAYLGEARQHVDSPYHSGIADLRMALELDPESLSALSFMSLYWQRRGQLDIAKIYLSKAINVEPGNPVLLIDMGKLTAVLGDLGDARSYYERAIDLAPNDPAYLVYLVEFCIAYNVSLVDLALPAARQALILAPDDPASLDAMGQLMLRLGDNNIAERFLRQSIVNDPEYLPAYLHLGWLFILEGNSAMAKEYISTILDQPRAVDASVTGQARRLMEDYLSP